MPKGLLFRLTDYLELVDWIGRMQRQDKPGCIDKKKSPILERLYIETENGNISASILKARLKGWWVLSLN